MTTKQVPFNDPGNQQMAEASGMVENSSRLVCFLFLLARDEMPVGKIEGFLERVDALKGEPIVYSNGWLASWAEHAEARLLKPLGEVTGNVS